MIDLFSAIVGIAVALIVYFLIRFFIEEIFFNLIVYSFKKQKEKWPSLYSYELKKMDILSESDFEMYKAILDFKNLRDKK